VHCDQDFGPADIFQDDRYRTAYAGVRQIYIGLLCLMCRYLMALVISKNQPPPRVAFVALQWKQYNTSCRYTQAKLVRLTRPGAACNQAVGAATMIRAPTPPTFHNRVPHDHVVHTKRL
jgi:hypothetical protein